MAFGSLWGLIACHSYGFHGMRVPFPVRQMLRLLSQSISRHVERLSYARRVHTRKLTNTMVSSQHPTGYIVSTDDLLELFDADCGILVIGKAAKILGPHFHSHEMLIITEYLRLKKYSVIQASQAIVHDFPDLRLPRGLKTIAGLLLIPLSSQGSDFIAFFRFGKPEQVRWGGKPYKKGGEEKASLEPRKSFKIWVETVAGRCRPWTDEEVETAGVLALVYGKFIAVWRQKESALKSTKLTNLLLSNASHEVRTPLNHIINYLEMALNGPLDSEARENLRQSHAASKCLLFTINDLLDLTSFESGNETSFNEPFDLHQAIEQATYLYQKEAKRRNVDFRLELDQCPRGVIGDAKKIRTVVQNLAANSLKYTAKGTITVRCSSLSEGTSGVSEKMTAEILVADEGCGISSEKLDVIFRDLEQVESLDSSGNSGPSGMGLGLAVVARVVQQLNGHLRVNSSVGRGTRISIFIPLKVSERISRSTSSSSPSGRSLNIIDRKQSARGDIGNLMQSLVHDPITSCPQDPIQSRDWVLGASCPSYDDKESTVGSQKLRILVAEDNDINRAILAKRLSLDGHEVVNATNGQECIDLIMSDGFFDVVLMDIQMPIVSGLEASERIRNIENTKGFRKAGATRLRSHIIIFAISASIIEQQYDELVRYGVDGWILKPIDFRRLQQILRGVNDPSLRKGDVYHPGYNWEDGGWLGK